MTGTTPEGRSESKDRNQKERDVLNKQYTTYVDIDTTRSLKIYAATLPAVGTDWKMGEVLREREFAVVQGHHEALAASASKI